jgi:hypothetical protein
MWVYPLPPGLTPFFPKKMALANILGGLVTLTPLYLYRIAILSRGL